jgi:hypothetical protein
MVWSYCNIDGFTKLDKIVVFEPNRDEKGLRKWTIEFVNINSV